MNRTLSELPEAFVSNTAISSAVSRAVKAGELRRLASRLYTKNLLEPPEEVVRRNLWGIVAGYFPGALVADRTALEAAPASDGSVFLVSERGRTVELPGIVLRPRRGPGAAESDMPFVNGLHLSSIARAYLDNMRPSRARNGRVSRTLTRPELEERFDRLIRSSDEAGINRLRDDVRAVAAELAMEREATRFDALIGALLGTRDTRLDSSLGRARGLGQPYDRERMELFHKLHRALRNHPPCFRPSPPRDTPGSLNAGVLRGIFLELHRGYRVPRGRGRPNRFRGGDPAAQTGGRSRYRRDMAHRLRPARDEPNPPAISPASRGSCASGTDRSWRVDRSCAPESSKSLRTAQARPCSLLPNWFPALWSTVFLCTAAWNRRSRGPST